MSFNAEHSINIHRKKKNKGTVTRKQEALCINQCRSLENAPVRRNKTERIFKKTEAYYARIAVYGLNSSLYLTRILTVLCGPKNAGSECSVRH